MNLSEHTPKEMGLLKLCSYKKKTIESLSYELNQNILISSRTIGKLGGIQAVLDYREELGGFEKAWEYARIDDYTNKKGNTFKAFYTIHGKYLCRTNGKERHMYLGFVEVNSENIHKWFIKEDDKDFKLIAVNPHK